MATSVKAVEQPVKQPELVKGLDWELGRKKPLSVDEAIKRAIENNKIKPITPTPEPTKPKTPLFVQPSVRTETIKSGQGLHSHQCARCGNVFSHTSESFGNAAAHMCPKCGYGPNYRVLQ